MQHDYTIVQPLVTEKSVGAEANGKYTFRVLPTANKAQVKQAVEKIFGVKIAAVNIVNTHSKKRRRGRTVGVVSGFKKAVVTLKKGQSIKLREEKTVKEKLPKGAHEDLEKDKTVKATKIDTKKAKIVVREAKKKEGKQSR